MKGFAIEITGDRALFTNPIFKMERVTYPVITPSATRNILQSIYWHPGIEWHIDKIKVCNKIKYHKFTTNELKFKLTVRKNVEDSRANKTISQRSSMILRDVKYVVLAHFTVDVSKITFTEEGLEEIGLTSDSSDEQRRIGLENKVVAKVSKRLSKGQHFHQPYMGQRQFFAKVKRVSDFEAVESVYENEIMPLGVMFFDFNYDNNRQRIWYAPIMENGVIDVVNTPKIKNEVG
jgi:CRISPR-associated protein Cas5d